MTKAEKIQIGALKSEVEHYKKQSEQQADDINRLVEINNHLSIENTRLEKLLNEIKNIVK